MIWLVGILVVCLVAVGIDNYLQRKENARMEQWMQTWRKRSSHEH